MVTRFIFINFLCCIRSITIMFVSYSIDDKEFGFMCFKENISIKVIYDYICDRLWRRKIKIIYASKFSSDIKNKVIFHTSGKYSSEVINKPIRDVEDVDKIYIYLHDKYGYSNILGFV